MGGGEDRKLLGDESDGGGRAPEDVEARDPGCARVMHNEVTDSCLCFLKTFSVTTMAAGALVIAVNLYEIIDFRESYQMYAVRGYAVLLGLMIILAELEYPRLFLDYFKFLELWSLKGLFVVFVGVLTLDTEDNDSILQTGTAVFVCVLGVLYFLLGLFCVKTYRDHRKQGIHANADRKDRAARAGALFSRRDFLFGTRRALAGPRPAAGAAHGGRRPRRPQRADLARPAAGPRHPLTVRPPPEGGLILYRAPRALGVAGCGAPSMLRCNWIHIFPAAATLPSSGSSTMEKLAAQDPEARMTEVVETIRDLYLLRRFFISSPAL